MFGSIGIAVAITLVTLIKRGMARKRLNSSQASRAIFKEELQEEWPITSKPHFSARVWKRWFRRYKTFLAIPVSRAPKIVSPKDCACK